MGWNSTIVVLNDALHDIKNDPKFGENVYQAVTLLSRCEEDRIPGDLDIRAGCHCNAATAVEQHHADGTSLVAVGQNYGRSLGVFFPYGEEDEDVRLLKALAEKLGYRVSRKPKRK